MLKKANSTIKNYSFNMTAAVWEAATDIGIMAIVARYLNVFSFGDYAFVMAFVAVFRVLCGISIPVIMTREIAVHKDNAPQFLAAALAIQCVMSVLTFFLVAIIIHVLRDNTLVFRATCLAMLGVIFDFLAILFLSVAKGYERMEYVAYRTIICQTLFLGLLVGLVLFVKSGFLSIFVVYAFAHFIGFVYAGYITFTRFVRPKGPVDLQVCKYLFLEAYPVALRRFIRRVGFRIDTILMNFLKGNVETGLFHGAYKIMQGFMFVGESLVVSVFPVLSRHYVGAKQSLDKLYERSFRFLSVSGGLLGVMLLVFSEEFILLILGKKYLESGQVLKVFSAVIVFMFLSKLAERMLIVGKRQLIVTSIAGVALVVNVVFDFILIPKMGIVGAAVATFLAEVGLFGLGLYYTYRYVSEASVLVCILKVLMVFTVTCTVVTIVSLYVNKLAGMILGPSFYVLGITALGLIPMAEVYEIKDRILQGSKFKRLKAGRSTGGGGTS